MSMIHTGSGGAASRSQPLAPALAPSGAGQRVHTRGERACETHTDAEPICPHTMCLVPVRVCGQVRRAGRGGSGVSGAEERTHAVSSAVVGSRRGAGEDQHREGECATSVMYKQGGRSRTRQQRVCLSCRLHCCAPPLLLPASALCLHCPLSLRVANATGRGRQRHCWSRSTFLSLLSLLLAFLLSPSYVPRPGSGQR